MLPIFANPAGLWVVLGVPAILAIHFLQQRAQVARTSTWFLIEKFAPDSARGRTWDRLRTSRALWLQLLAVLLAAWVLGEPRWIRAQSAQTVVLVLDASVSMEPFRAAAVTAVEREMSLADGLAARTTWVVMTTNPRQPALYRGLTRDAAAAALAHWQPELGRHDAGPSLRLARNLAGGAGRTLFITDRREKAPADQRAVGVGQPLENVGFAGATVTRDGDGHVWRALVKNNAATPQRRTWRLEAGGTASPQQTLELAAGAMTEISARLPAGVDRALVVLSNDAFQADNRLPLLVPAPKPLTVAVAENDKGETAAFYRRLAASVEGVSIVAADTPATLRLAEVDVVALNSEPRGGIFWPPADRRAQAALMTEPVTPERHPLVSGLNWQGWFGTGPHGFTRGSNDTPLLWHGTWPIVWLRPPAGDAPGMGRKLVLGFDWATSNAARLPATVLLARRFLEAERDAQRSAYSANFDCGALVSLSGVPLDGELTVAFESAANTAVAGAAAPQAAPTETWTIQPSELTRLRAPGRPGFFAVRRGEELLVRGTAQFADPRQGDFRSAETFFTEIRNEREAALERNTSGDPFVVVWLVLLAGVALWSGWSRVSGSEGAPAHLSTKAGEGGRAAV